MIKMTSAYASKLLKQLDEEKNFYLTREDECSTYVVADDEEPVVPTFDYQENAKALEEIHTKIQAIKHAINLANASHILSVDGKEYSVDTVLVRMALLNRRKDILNRMRRMQPKERINHFTTRNNVSEYRFINFDLDQVKADYEKVTNEIMLMQIALDRYNQTVEFEVDI